MNPKYFIYALLVTVMSTGTNWVRLFASAGNSCAGSSWSSHSSGGGYGGGAGGGGGHK